MNSIRRDIIKKSGYLTEADTFEEKEIRFKKRILELFDNFASGLRSLSYDLTPSEMNQDAPKLKAIAAKMFDVYLPKLNEIKDSVINGNKVMADVKVFKLDTLPKELPFSFEKPEQLNFETNCKKDDEEDVEETDDDEI